MSPSAPPLAIPRSILDTDLYKLTMQQAVLQQFPDKPSTYRFTLRDKSVRFTKESIDTFRTAVSHFSDLSLSESERTWLGKTCPFFTADYLDYLAAYRFRPEQVKIDFIPTSEDGLLGTLDIETTGLWVDTILWEVPLMACLSETYFTSVETDWNYDQQSEIAYSKAKTLIEGNCVFIEFGTRRRRTFETQDIVIAALIRASKEVSGKGSFVGTSNTHLAHKYGIKPAGTVAHEWFMGIGAINGYEDVNSLALQTWEAVYPSSNLLALTDTFSSEAFFKSFTPERARHWWGLRQDSGDPFTFGVRAKEVYESLGIDHREKAIIYSDSLDLDLALRLQKHNEGLGFVKSSYGIGTFFTNDFCTASSGRTEKSKALNMVIKLSSVDGKPCVKISDDLTKNTGDSETVKQVKRQFGLPI